MASQTQTAPIYAVGIGIHRCEAEKTVDLFNDTPYEIAAILDKAESPEALQYSPHNLAAVLNALYPRPRILVTGTALPDDMLPAIEKAWNDYVKRWQVDGLWVAMSKKFPDPWAPPPPGAMEHMMETLNQKFLK